MSHADADRAIRRMSGPEPIRRAVRGMDAAAGAPMDGFTASRRIALWTGRPAQIARGARLEAQ